MFESPRPAAGTAPQPHAAHAPGPANPPRAAVITNDADAPARPNTGNKLFYAIAAVGAIGAAIWVGPTLIHASPAPPFTLTQGSNGREVSLSDYAGHVVVLDFWASWCPPCRAAIPAIERLHQQYKDQGVKFIGINVSDNVDAQDFMRKTGGTYTVLTNGDEVSQAYGVKGIPTLVVIGKDGSIKYKESGWAPQLETIMQGVIEKELAN